MYGQCRIQNLVVGGVSINKKCGIKYVLQYPSGGIYAPFPSHGSAHEYIMYSV